jgi:hypothetical protein
VSTSTEQLVSLPPCFRCERDLQHDDVVKVTQLHAAARPWLQHLVCPAPASRSATPSS